MKVAPFLIDRFASFLIGSDVFSRVKATVERQDAKELTGEEKRAAAVSEFKTIGLEIAKWAVNLAIELAVAFLRSKAGQTAVK